MTQKQSTMHGVGTMGFGLAVAVLVLFAIEYCLPDLYAAMNDLVKQALTAVVMLTLSRIWSLIGPKGGMEK